MAKSNSVTAFFKGIYHDEFKWSLVKSIGFFALGIRIAQEFQGVELLTTPPFNYSCFTVNMRWLLGVVFLEFLGSITTEELPNFVFVLTDDQDLVLNGLTPMKNTLKLIADEGMTFSNAFVNSPICCPSRSTILTGHYAHNHGVRNNSVAGNCSSPQWQQEYEPRTIAALLQAKKNYTTFYAGKYLNQYGMESTGGTKHVPKGYNWWIGLKGNSQYYNYTLSINGTAQTFPKKYLTDLLADYAFDFLKQKSIATQPFFMMIAPPAPHAPFTPAPRHRGEFTDVELLRNPAFNYSSDDKHWVVEMSPKHLPSNVSILENMYRNRWRTLLAVDEMVSKLITKLDSLQILNKTYLIFSSDNGFHIGQFTQPWDKRQPYESDIRVPLLIRGPGIKEKSFTNYPISSVDILPTILDIANISNVTSDGTSFKSQLFQPKTAEVLNKTIFVEYWGEGRAASVDVNCGFSLEDSQQLAQCSLDSWCKCQDARNNTYTCLLEFITDNHIKCCKFEDGFVEAYDLKNDPFELKNIFNNFEEDTKIHYLRLIQKFLE